MSFVLKLNAIFCNQLIKLMLFWAHINVVLCPIITRYTIYPLLVTLLCLTFSVYVIAAQGPLHHVKLRGTRQTLILEVKISGFVEAFMSIWRHIADLFGIYPSE